jgi:hypothetical protein
MECKMTIENWNADVTITSCVTGGKSHNISESLLLVCKREVIILASQGWNSNHDITKGRSSVNSTELSRTELMLFSRQCPCFHLGSGQQLYFPSPTGPRISLS